MKINRKQRFPRIYTQPPDQVRSRLFRSVCHARQFARLKTALERTFKLRPCLYNIRGNDPHPGLPVFSDAYLFAPCNDDIDRSRYLADVDAAIAFIQGRDEEIEAGLIWRNCRILRTEQSLRKPRRCGAQLEKIQRARQEIKDTFTSLWAFNYLVVLPSRQHIATEDCLCTGREHRRFRGLRGRRELREPFRLKSSAFSGPLPAPNREWQYDEFCLVCQLHGESPAIRGSCTGSGLSDDSGFKSVRESDCANGRRRAKAHSLATAMPS